MPGPRSSRPAPGLDEQAANATAPPDLVRHQATGTALASIVVTIRRDDSGVMTVHVKPAADNGDDELMAGSLEAYAAPGPPNTLPRPLRRRRSTLAGGLPPEPTTGRDENTGPAPRQNGLTTRGIPRRSAVAAALAVLAALAAVALIASPVSRPSTAPEPTTLPAPQSTSTLAPVATPTDCSPLPAWINGLYGLYVTTSDAQSASPNASDVATSPSPCLGRQATTPYTTFPPIP
jgi:hypothetical protein